MLDVIGIIVVENTQGWKKIGTTNEHECPEYPVNCESRQAPAGLGSEKLSVWLRGWTRARTPVLLWFSGESAVLCRKLPPSRAPQDFQRRVVGPPPAEGESVRGWRRTWWSGRRRRGNRDGAGCLWSSRRVDSDVSEPLPRSHQGRLTLQLFHAVE